MKTVGNIHATFGEGPLWDEEKQTILWVDIYTCRLLTCNIRTLEEKAFQLPGPATAILKYSEEEYLLVMSREINIFHCKTETLTQLVSFDFMAPELLLNDAKLDGVGRIWLGSVDDRFKYFKESSEGVYSQYPHQIGRIYCVDRDLSIRTFEYPIAISNGLAFSSGYQYFYHIDSNQQGITKYDFDLEEGSISNPRLICDFPMEQGFPDGMTIDEHDDLWVALFRSHSIAQQMNKNAQIVQVDGETGDVKRSIELPLHHVTSCTFGGEQLNRLYVTTAKEPLFPPDGEKRENSGCLFEIDVQVKGVNITPVLLKNQG